MLQAAIPDFEEQRLEALRKLRLWKSAEEEGFDRITRLVKSYFKAPVVQINLVGDGYVWAKSQVGNFPAEIKREKSICAHTILENDVFCISDIQLDDRFNDSVYTVENTPIRFYTGIPLKIYGGFNVATLCVMDVKPRDLQFEEYEVLREFAEAVQQQFSLSRLEQDGKFLVAQTSRLNTLLEALPDGIVTIDSKNKLETVNGSAARIFGYEQSELEGMDFNDLMPDLGQGGWDGYLEILLNSETSFKPDQHYNLNGKRKDGSLFPMELEVREMYLEGSLSYTGIIRDITERKKVEDELIDGRQTLEVTKENVPAGITVFDDTYKLKVINAQVSKLLELPQELTKIGVKFKKIVQFMFDRGDFGSWPEERAKKELDKIIRVLKSPRFIHIKGSDRYIEITSRVMPGGGFVSTYLDITARLKNEEKLEELLRQANEANSAKTNFLSTISHEIRTPLNGVIGVAHMLGETKLASKQKEMLNTILHSGNTLLSLINDVLDMNKIEAGSIEIEHILCDFNEIISSVRAPFDVQADLKGIALQFSVSDDLNRYVFSDPTRLRQVLMNLLGNAMKFTEVGEISVELLCLKKISPTKQLVKIAVCDTGVGIAEDRLPAIFDSFSQADNTINRRFGGTGLGLSIVRKLIELMDGEISVSSVEGKGTTFSITLPMEIAPEEKVQEQNARLKDADFQDTKGLDVLVAEDNDINAMITTSFLKTLGHKSEVVENGQLAVDALDTRKFDLVLMDIHMPVLDGIEATKKIRTKYSSKILPIIGVTAEAFADRHAYMKEIGINDIITKPFTKQQLHEVIAIYFAKTGRIVKTETVTSSSEQVVSKKATSGVIDYGMLEVTQNISIGSDEKISEFYDQLGEEVTVSLIEKTPDSVKSELKILKQGLDDRDEAIVKRAAHTIVGVASSMCAERIAEQASIFENNAAQLDDILAVFPIFEETAEATFEWWSAHIRKSD